MHFGQYSLPFLVLSTFLFSLNPETTRAVEVIKDPQIAHIAVTANQIDIDAGKFAKKRTTREDVKAFTEKMIFDHTQAVREAKALANDLKLKLAENSVSKTLQKKAKIMEEQLSKRKSDFDLAYLESEARFHQEVLDSLDGTLIPGAENERLKELLLRNRSLVAEHLGHVKELQAKMTP